MTAEVALTDPALAVIVALPFSTDVTRPADDTVATVASDVDHVTEALDIVAPFWFFTVAVSEVVSPSEARVTLGEESVIEVATGTKGCVGVAGPPPGSPPQETSPSSIRYLTGLFVI